MNGSAFVTRIKLQNYKSIAGCDVRLGPLTFLVGPNGSGKSNFLDALRFVADSLRTNLDHALRDRGGINEVVRRSEDHPTEFGMQLQMDTRDGRNAFYAFRIAANSPAGFEVRSEECTITAAGQPRADHHFRVRDGQVESSLAVAPAVLKDRLYLGNLTGLPEFRPLFDLLSRMGFYNFHPDRMREMQPPDAGELLARDGSNIAGVLRQLGLRDPGTKRRIEEYLAAFVEGVTSVDACSLGRKETLEFRQKSGAGHPVRFTAANMSDGTLRMLGVLAAVFQSDGAGGPRIPLVGIEEPEAALHPGAAGALNDALREASEQKQILVTSHSPELLDDKDIEIDEILAVAADEGVTRIGRLDAIDRDGIREHHITPGELLRGRQLAPEASAVSEISEQALFRFEGVAG